MSEPEHKHCPVCTFYGVKLFAENCDEKKATALARIFARYEVRGDMKIDSILEEAGLKPKPPVKHQAAKASITDEKNRPQFSDREEDEKKRLHAAKNLDDEDKAERPGVERDPPRLDPDPVAGVNAEPVKPLKDEPKQPKK